MLGKTKAKQGVILHSVELSIACSSVSTVSYFKQL